MRLTVGVIGYGISRTLLTSLMSIPQIYSELKCDIRLKTICGRNQQAAEITARSFDFQKSTGNWIDIIEDPQINLLINAGPNYLHPEPCIQALEAGKHVFCEKPLAHSLQEARRMAGAARRAETINMVGYNYRFVPAVILARKLIHEGKLGRIYQSRFSYLDEAFADPLGPYSWRMEKALSGRGVLADLGSHAIDLARCLLGEPSGASGLTCIIVPQRSGKNVTAPDAAYSRLHFTDGSIANLEASSFCTGRKNSLSFEIHGEKGALRWDLEELNDLHIYSTGEKVLGTAGFHVVKVSNMDQPELLKWPGAFPLGVDHSYTTELRHLIECIAQGRTVTPEGADFHDGLLVEIVAEAIEESSRNQGKLVNLSNLAPL